MKGYKEGLVVNILIGTVITIMVLFITVSKRPSRKFLRGGKTQSSELIVNPSSSHDSITLKDTLVSHFKIVNSGKKIIKIDSIKAECSCTMIFYQVNTLDPGDTTEITLRFIPYALGVYNKLIKIYSDCSDSPHYFLSNYYVYR